MAVGGGDNLLMPPERLRETYEECIILISALSYRKEIMEQIKVGATNKIFHVFAFDPSLHVYNVTLAERRSFYLESRSRLNLIYNRLADDLSRQTLVEVIRGALTSDCDCYGEIADEAGYFPSLILERMNAEEVFVDLGAYIGDTIMEFTNACKNQYKRIYGFEPDPRLFAVCEKNCSDNRILLFQCGAGKEKAALSFLSEDGMGWSHFVKEGEGGLLESIEVVRLDDLIRDEVTYIKMDIEGMEMDALQGAERLIREYKPKLAVCVYHKPEDIVEIPEYLDSLNLGYQLYLRHAWRHCGTDTVLFAV